MDPLITLTTDFGERDPYAAAMKGVIAGICPEARILDLTHAIPPQDIEEAARFLGGCAPFFPGGTIHVVVVDPGVGSERRGIAACIAGRTYVCPDNGVLSGVLGSELPSAVHALSNRRFMLEPASATFHGRDIFAPMAAHLARGVPIEELGEPLDDVVRIGFAEATVRADGRVCGQVVHVDRFGNAVTNIHVTDVAGSRAGRVHAGGRHIGPISRTYGDVPSQAALALWGSSGYLEIAIHGGHAGAELGLGPGDPVELLP